MQKIKIVNPCVWKHHYQGWRWVIENLNQLHDDNAIRFESAADRCNITEDWVGFVHGVPRSPSFIEMQYGHRWDLHDFLKNQSLQSCKKLWTLCEYTASFLRNNISIPVCNLKYPTTNCSLKFEKADKIVLIGHWLRDWQKIYDLKSCFSKYILKGGDVDYNVIIENFKIKPNNTVRYLNRLNNAEYDMLLQKSLVFLPLFDVAAATTIVECIIRNTPILTNRLPASIEYLGNDYPLFYNDIEEASIKSNDMKLIQRASDYLASMDKSCLYIEYFMETFKSS